MIFNNKKKYFFVFLGMFCGMLYASSEKIKKRKREENEMDSITNQIATLNMSNNLENKRELDITFASIMAEVIQKIESMKPNQRPSKRVKLTQQ